ncbi:MAG TPA: SCO family protein [Acidimicrobiales bacterium]|nr:SCO family protein [Acidimicrobiales bacterium]
MTNEVPPGKLSEEQRRAVFRRELEQTTARGQRPARPRLPPRFVLVVAAAFLTLGLGGAVLDHFYGAGGSSPATTTTVSTSATTTTSRALDTAAFIGLKEIATAQAPPINLRDQTGRAWHIDSQRGRVVLLAFYAKNCRDICPVVGTELRDAVTTLQRRGISVDVAIVNTDPSDLAVDPRPAALLVPGLADRSNVQFLTGSLRQLDTTWSNYGVVVKIGASASEVAHNNVIYFIGPRGQLSALAVPFGHVSRAQVYSLPANLVRRFAGGIATEASSLAR